MTSHYFGHFLFVRSEPLTSSAHAQRRGTVQEDKHVELGVTGGHLRGFLWTKGRWIGGQSSYVLHHFSKWKLVTYTSEGPCRRKWQPTPSILALEIPWTEEPGGLQPMGSQSQTWPSNENNNNQWGGVGSYQQRTEGPEVFWCHWEDVCGWKRSITSCFKLIFNTLTLPMKNIVLLSFKLLLPNITLFINALNFIFYLFKHFFWSIVDLQCCVSYRYTAKWISYTYTYIHSCLGFFSHLGIYRVLNRGPRALR